MRDNARLETVNSEDIDDPIATVLPMPRSRRVVASRGVELAFQLSRDAICVVVGSRIEVSNRAFQRLTGYSASEIIGEDVMAMASRGCSEVIPFQVRKISRTLLKVPGVHDDVAIFRKDGSVSVMSLDVLIVRDIFRT